MLNVWRSPGDDSVGAIVVTGAGKMFCVGVDMDMKEMLEDAQGRAFYHATTLQKPVICAINGSAAGVGLAIACHCDVRFCSASAKLTTAYGRRGLVVEHGLSWVLPRLVGTGAAMDLCVSARIVKADEAAQLGLVNFVCPADQVLRRAMDYASDLCVNVSPGSMAAAKFQVLRHATMSQRDALAESNDLMHVSEHGGDIAEGFTAFSEKRSPRFQTVSQSPVAARIRSMM
mmetsp:Transcript_70485/g.187730  ORF Transcript_70485/g.187730 Transcript_70485/m.187730 type:complete len:230 (-) Transcript_70485:80-769(-)